MRETQTEMSIGKSRTFGGRPIIKPGAGRDTRSDSRISSGCNRIQQRHTVDLTTLQFQEQIHLFFLVKLPVSLPHLHRSRVTVAIRSAPDC